MLLKKIINITFCFLIIAFLTTTALLINFFTNNNRQTIYATPIKTLEKELEYSETLNKVITLTQQNKFEEAINTLDFVNAKDFLLLKNSNSIYSKLIKEYKKILVSTANSYYQNKEYTLALNLLNSKHKYYINDETINDLIKLNKAEIQNSSLVEYKGEIEHLYTHCLLAYPEIALNPKNSLSKELDNNYITPTEFKNILNELYAKNYILININSIYTTEDNNVVKQKLMLPPDKKPIIFSFDDVSYESKKQSKGMVDKIILDRNGNIATYTSKKSIQDRVTYNNEFVTIMESFIKEHPDFSFNGARGIICLNGYDGILGYRTQRTNATSRFEIKKALQVVNKLKNLGWEFASHGYGKSGMNSLSDMEFAKEISYFENEVIPIIGKTSVYMYQNNEPEIFVNENYTNKQKMLNDAGFKLFCKTDDKTSLSTISNSTNSILLMNRKPLDGFSLRNKSYDYAHLFNCELVFDHTNRTIPYNNKNN